MTEPASTDPVIRFDRVSISFDEGEILHDISFSVAPRETKVLVGESGSGKTLILKLTAGLLRPTSGRILVLGQNITEMSEDDLLAFRRQLGVVFQEGALFDSDSVHDNVAYRLYEENEPDEEIEPRVREALRFVELEDALEKFPSELSGGMRRRVSIARAIVDHPPIVLYDSPTAGLDPVTSQTIITLILRLRDVQGVTALLATHRLQDAFALANFRFDSAANRVVPLSSNGTRPSVPPTSFLVLRDGRIYFQGDPKAILDSPDPYLKKFLV